MPRYYFTCGACNNPIVKFLKPGEQKSTFSCGECGGLLLRTPVPPTSQVTENIDDGAMAHRITRLADAERLYKDRGANDPRNKP